MNLFQNFIERFSSSSKQFFSNSANIKVGYAGAVWLDTSIPNELYSTIPQLYNPVNKLAAMFSNAEIKVLDENGNNVGTDEFYKLIANPNFSQSMNEWLYSFLVQKLVYGNTYMYKNAPSQLSSMPLSLWNLSPCFLRPVFTGKSFDQISLDEVISKYVYTVNNVDKDYFTSDIMHTKITDIDNPFIGKSPLIALRFPLTNTKLAYEYRNVIMGKRGAIGVLSPETSKDSMGAVPFTKENRKDIIDQHLNSFGVQEGKSPLIISDTPLKWMPMTFPTKDLLLFEEIDANFMTILDTLGVNRNIYKDSSFENQKSGLIQTYEDTIYPHADQLGQDLTKFLKIPIGNVTFSYSHLSILQSDKNSLADTFQKQINAVVQLFEKNLVDKQGAVEMLISLSGITINSSAETTIDRLNQLSPLVANNVVQQLLINEIRAIVNAPTIASGDVRPVEANSQFNVPFGAPA